MQRLFIIVKLPISYLNNKLIMHLVNYHRVSVIQELNHLDEILKFGHSIIQE